MATVRKLKNLRAIGMLTSVICVVVFVCACECAWICLKPDLRPFPANTDRLIDTPGAKYLNLNPYDPAPAASAGRVLFGGASCSVCVVWQVS